MFPALSPATVRLLGGACVFLCVALGIWVFSPAPRPPRPVEPPPTPVYDYRILPVTSVTPADNHQEVHALFKYTPRANDGDASLPYGIRSCTLHYQKGLQQRVQLRFVLCRADDTFLDPPPAFRSHPNGADSEPLYIFSVTEGRPHELTLVFAPIPDLRGENPDLADLARDVEDNLMLTVQHHFVHP